MSVDTTSNSMLLAPPPNGQREESPPGPVASESQKIPDWRPFPVDVIPEPFRSLVRQGSRALGCDPTFIAVPILTAAAGAIGNSRTIRLKAGWDEPSIIWSAVVAESGTQKTPAMGLVLRPLREIEEKQLKDYALKRAEYERDLLTHERDLQDWKKEKSTRDPPETPSEPHPKRILADDTTVEALVSLLAKNPRGLLLAADELSRWFGSLDRYKSGKGDAGLWLQMHTGEPTTFDRKTGTPPMIHVSRAAVSILGGIQPGVLKGCLEDGHQENGLAARLLLAYPPRRRKQWSEETTSQEVIQSVGGVFQKLLSLRFETSREGVQDPIPIPLSPEGKKGWIEFYNLQAEEQMDLEGELAAKHSKLEAYAARFAIVVHCVRWAAGDPALADEFLVDADSIRSGIAISRWFGNEAKRLAERERASALVRREMALVDYIRSKDGSITARELQQRKRDYRPTEKAETALDSLAKRAWGTWRQIDPGPEGGRPTRRFVLTGPVTATETSESPGDSEVSEA